MAIDDGLDFPQTVIEAEVRETSPVLRFVPSLERLLDALAVKYPTLTSFMPFAAGKVVLSGIALYLAHYEEGQRKYLTDCLRDELRRVRTSHEQLDEFVRRDWGPLVLYGLQKAETIRAQSRIQRIAKILAHAFEVGPSGDSDLAEEMMRIAVDLSDQDVVVLGAIHSIQSQNFDPATGRVADTKVPMKVWKEIAEQSGLLPGNLVGVCGKLASYGLIAETDPEMGKARWTKPYVMLSKTADFIRYIGGAAAGGGPQAMAELP